MKWILTGVAVALLAILIGVVSLVAAPEPSNRPLAASTPDELIDSIFRAIEEREPRRIATLIDAPDEDFAQVVNRIGWLLHRLQRLSDALEERFPSDVQALRAEAAQRAGQGGARGLLAVAQSAGGGGGGGRDALVALLADPFGWAAGERARFTTIPISSDQSALLIDGKPAFGVGMVIVRRDGRWRIALPLELPMVAEYVPRTPEEHQILASMIHVVDNAVADLTTEVREGRCTSLDDAARTAGEMAVAPMVMCFIAYDRALKARAEQAEAAR